MKINFFMVHLIPLHDLSLTTELLVKTILLQTLETRSHYYKYLCISEIK